MKIAKYILKNKFNAGLIIILTGIFFYQIFIPSDVIQETRPSAVAEKSIHIFYLPECPHCQKAITFLQKLHKNHPDVTLQTHNVAHQNELSKLTEVAKQHSIMQTQLKVPLIVIGNNILIGYDDDHTTGRKIQALVEQLSQPLAITKTPQVTTPSVKIPIVGELDVFEFSLPTLAVVLGIVDGFNPCAMWVLVYMISLIVGLKDRTRVFVIIGTFLLASGILYFLFMSVWLNVFLLVGYIKSLTLAIGLSALYLGINSIYNFILSGGQIVCKVGDIGYRQARQTKIKDLLTSPLTITTLIGIILLAFAVNSVEFICSSALPAVFTHVLSLSDLSPLGYYSYILLYVFFFMLDDLVIFVTAALAVQRFAGEKYAGLCQIIGGVILVGLGIILSFFPELLRALPLA